jgi:ribosomal protein L40E
MDDTKSAIDPLICARCNQALKFVGTKKFHEGTHWGVLGELGELFENREHFDVYVCSRCGRVELFVDGTGEEFRPN